MSVDGILSKPKTTAINLEWLAIAALAVFYVLFILYALTLPVKINWPHIFRPAVFNLISGQSPYSVDGFYNPPWVLLPLIPFSLLPERIGYLAISAISFLAFVHVARKIGASPLALFALIMNPATLYNFYNVNLDWLVLLGLILPPRYGIFLVLVKPQLGIAVVVYWLFMEWKKGGILAAIKLLLPVSVLFALSFVFYGSWITKPMTTIQAYWNINLLWPLTIPAGLMILYKAIRSRSAGPAFFSSPFFSPYVQAPSLPIAMFGLVNSPKAFAAGIAATWLIWLWLYGLAFP